MTCVLCGGVAFETIAQRLRYGIERPVVKCVQCSLVSLENPTDQIIDYAAQEYRQRHGPTPGQPTTPQELFEASLTFHERGRRELSALLQPEFEVLDIGCSAGMFLHVIKDDVKRVVGIEPDPKMAEFARVQLGMEVYQGFAGELPQDVGDFDVVFAFHVFEHVPDPLAFLDQCRRYLKPEGRICIEVPNIDEALMTVYGVPSFPEFTFRAPHLYYYSPHTLSAMLEKGGFNGETEMVAHYSLANHLHWATTGTPQSDPRTGTQIPDLIPADGWEDVGDTLVEWLRETDSAYRSLLNEHGISDSVRFIGSRR